jgi:hypothetical protein
MQSARLVAAVAELPSLGIMKYTASFSRWHKACMIAPLFLLGCRTQPICVYYPPHQEQVQVSDVPKDLVDAFYRACPHANLVSVSKLLDGKTGSGLIF